VPRPLTAISIEGVVPFFDTKQMSRFEPRAVHKYSSDSSRNRAADMPLTADVILSSLGSSPPLF
jgi:hypothetical protein